jgi:hypothetical protein
LQSGDVSLVYALKGSARSFHLESLTDVVKIQDILDSQRPYREAPTTKPLDQPFLYQAAKSFSYRCATE